MEENKELFFELMNAAISGSIAFCNGEIALNSGELEVCQEQNKKGVEFVQFLIKDTFNEFVEIYGEEKASSYEEMNNLNLAVKLSIISKDCGRAIELIDEGDTILAEKLCKSISAEISAVKEIFAGLYEN